jgi:hypothetical protein
LSCQYRENITSANKYPLPNYKLANRRSLSHADLAGKESSNKWKTTVESNEKTVTARRQLFQEKKNIEKQPCFAGGLRNYTPAAKNQSAVHPYKNTPTKTPPSAEKLTRARKGPLKAAGSMIHIANPGCSYRVHQRCIHLYFRAKTDMHDLPFYCPTHAPF